MWVTENCRVCVGEGRVDGDTPQGGDWVMNPLVPVAMDDSVGGRGEGVSAQGVGVMDPPHPPLGDPVRVNVRDTLMVPPPQTVHPGMPWEGRVWQCPNQG